MADHVALIARLEALTGPDREVDALLWAHFDGRTVRELDGMLLARSSRRPNDECIIGFVDPGKLSSNVTAREPIPNVTASLDAVIALVERELPGWRIEMRIGEWPPHYPGGVVLWNNDTKAKTSVFGIAAKGATPAIALMIALLRSKPNGGDNG